MSGSGEGLGEIEGETLGLILGLKLGDTEGERDGLILEEGLGLEVSNSFNPPYSVVP